MKKYVLSIDQGTTSTRAILFSRDGKAAAQSSRPFTQRYPKAGYVEHDPEEIWESVVAVIAEALAKAGASAGDVDSVGITNQRETVIVWDKKTGKPVYNAIVWQCRRTAEYCEELKASGAEKTIYDKTGLIIDAYFSASKIKWILDNVSGAREKAEKGALAFGTVDTFILWRLSGGKIFKTDYTNASRTMLFDIRSLCYDEELLRLFGVPKNMLPEVCPSKHLFGYTDEKVFGAVVPVTGVAGDQQASLFGHLCLNVGDAKCTYGTGCFLLMNTGDKFCLSKRGLITTLAASGGKSPHYAVEGSVFIGGAAVQWLRDEMGLISSSAESETLALSVENTGGVYFVPAFVGLGAPHWDADARGLICGITRGTNRAHIVRATLEAVAFQVNDVIHAMESDTGIRAATLEVDGGATANKFLMEFQSDVSGKKIIRPAMAETTALGAAYLAGLYTGFYASESELKKFASSESEFKPKISAEERQKLIFGWGDAILKAKAR